MLIDSVSRLFGGNVGGTGSWAQGSTADAGPAGQTAAQPAMSAADVQQALLTTPDGAPQVSGIGQSGSGAWYSQMQPGMQGIDYNALMASAPGAYNNVYAPAMEQTLNQILGRQPFAYDVNADGLYQQIKDNYIKAGRQAMMDTQGQAAALTGGYGNSYAAQAGQQAYQESLGNLANAIPQLAQQAYAQYMDQGDQLRNNLEAMRLLEGQDYSRWLDDQERYQAFLKEMPSIMEHQAAASGRLGGGRIYSQMEPDISSYGPRTPAAAASKDPYFDYNLFQAIYAHNKEYGDWGRDTYWRLRDQMPGNFSDAAWQGTLDEIYGTNTTQSLKDVIKGRYGNNGANSIP